MRMFSFVALLGVTLLAAACGDNEEKKPAATAGQSSFSVTASTVAPLTQDEVTLTALGENLAAVTWTDDCRGEFSASDGTTTTWTNTWAEKCRIRASAGDVTQEVTLSVAYKAGTVETVAGTACASVGAGADNRIPFAVEEVTPGSEALFSHTYSALTGLDGGIYFTDRFGGRVFKYDPSASTVEVIAGLLEGNDGSSAPATGQPATEIALNDPWGLAQDAAGNLYIAEYGEGQIRKVFANAGTMTTVADSLNVMALDQTADGNFLVVAGNNGNQLTRFYPASGTTFTLAAVGNAFDIAVRRNDGAIFTANRFDNQVFQVAATNFTTTVVAGTGDEGSTGDQGPAAAATLKEPFGLYAADDGKIFIAERGNARIRLVGPNGKIRSVVGPGINYTPGQAGPIHTSPGIQPTSVTLDGEGNLYFTDRGDCTLKKAYGPF